MARLDRIELSRRDLGVTFTSRVIVKDFWPVRLGMRIIRLGCWIAGFAYREEEE